LRCTEQGRQLSALHCEGKQGSQRGRVLFGAKHTSVERAKLFNSSPQRIHNGAVVFAADLFFVAAATRLAVRWSFQS
jgi:hypothetical protein